MATNKWSLDPTHSELQFKVKHLMITNVTGQFNVISGDVEFEGDDFSQAKVNFAADAESINTTNEQRDAHLRSADFLDAATYPAIRFDATGFNASEGTINGNLTIRDVTKPVTFEVEFSGTNKDPWGNEKAGFSLTGSINRTDFGLNWNTALETGGVLVGENVRVVAELQFVKQQQA